MEYIVLAGAIVLLILFLMGNEYLNSRAFRRQYLARVYGSYAAAPERNYREGEMEHIRMYWHKHPSEHQIDDITWNDLNMDAIYQSINASCSAAGDEYLYYRLRTPVDDPAEMERMESMIEFFMEHESERHAVQRVLVELGRMGRYSIYEYLDNLDTLGERRNGKYVFGNLALLIGVGTMFMSLPIGVVILMGVLCHNIIGYFKEYKEIEPYITSFRYITRLLAGAQQLGRGTVSGIEKEQARLLECCRQMKTFVRNTYLIVFTDKGNGNPLGVLLDYVRMIFYLDLIQFNKALQAVRGHLAEIDELITLIGQIETAVVIGSYRGSLADAYCIPVIDYGKSAERKLVLEEAYHPLLLEPVCNSITARQGVLLTGSNASGKSTFLRAVAVNALLAQTIHTCTAKRYEAPYLRIYSSMALKDDLVGGQSYYMVEIKSIKRILDQVKRAKEDHCHVLCFVDEVLRGTNTVERIAASTQIMKMLAAGHAICFAATHDVELTRLLEKEYDNYHFEERIEEDDIFFPYKLMEGPATTRNAIALLRMLGYDGAIITEAESMAQHFLDEGSW